MRREENVALAHRWFEEVWNRRRTETIDELLLPTSIGHLETGDVHGAEEFKPVRAQLLSALPDLRLEIEDTAAEGENVVVRWRVCATHQGEGLGVAPTQRAVEIRGITWLRIRDGHLVEGWDSWNLGGLIARLQADEAPAARATAG
ncbi:MAG TPA: ester cyclase [Thermoanaerobaculia bacterium]|jgi:steroid delta-isomerase-like uncharacterized protein